MYCYGAIVNYNISINNTYANVIFIVLLIRDIESQDNNCIAMLVQKMPIYVDMEKSNIYHHVSDVIDIPKTNKTGIQISVF